jgi:hypothetical protein
MRTAPNNSESTIDSRDIIERIKELEAERDSCMMIREDGGEEADPQGWEDQNPEDAAELAALSNLAEDGEGAADWTYGETLIRDDYFTEYVREMLKDCGEIPRDLPHYIAVDWHKTANNVRVDYFDVDFDGVTYWIR